MTGRNPAGTEDFPSPAAPTSPTASRVEPYAARQARAARLAPGRAERYRLATYWLAVAPGWLSWRACHGGSTYEIAHGAHGGGPADAAGTSGDQNGFPGHERDVSHGSDHPVRRG